ncbi:MAG TPA: DUF2203 domain-containing protein [Candidatus Nanoarchaeia archaeon]|nr:DUF2203 domain-containing protein [Candidatus Nanoarchaeia archaeon]
MTSDTIADIRKKYFTLQEAKHLLPTIQTSLKKLISLKNALTLLSTVEIDFEDYNYEHNLLSLRLNKKFHKLSYDFYKHLENLEQHGCIVKDLDLGLVDFYSKHQGRDILLCWRLGEQHLGHWHEVNSGYAERKPISLLKEKHYPNT